MLKISPISRLLTIFAVFILPIATVAFEGEAQITGCYLDSTVRDTTNQKDAYKKLIQALNNRIGYSIATFPPNPEKGFVIGVSYMFPKVCLAVEADTFIKMNQLRDLQSKWVKTRLIRKNLYSDLFYFSARALSTDNKLTKVTGLVKLVPMIPIPNSDIKKGAVIKMETLEYRAVSWEFIRFSTNNNKGIALKKIDLAGKIAETDLVTGNPVYSKRLKTRANVITFLRLL